MAEALVWSVSVSVPFDWQWSKNRMWVARAGSYARRLADHARARRDGLAFALRAELKGRKVSNNRLLVQIHVEIPDHKGDAINCLDLVCDGIEHATGLNDKWYSLSGLTWAVAKTNPQLKIWIGQVDVTDSKVCGTCGEILPFGDFGVAKNTATGRASRCKSCRATVHREQKAERDRLAAEDSPPEPEPAPEADPPWRS